jgi:hypothetical protein
MAQSNGAWESWLKELDAHAVYQTRESNPYLEPEDSPFLPPLMPAIHVYELMVAKILLEPAEAAFRLGGYGEARREVAGLVCIPSFEPEWALWLAGERKGGFSVLLTEAENNIWYSSRKPEAQFPMAVRKSEGQLESSLAGAICGVWRGALSQARYSKDQAGGNDGVTYHFGYWDVGARMAGKAWSPTEQTAPGKLAAISHALRDYLRNEGPASQQIIQAIEEHLAWFQKTTE